jgi:lipopolysaccharide transport protein LptA
VGKPKIQLRHVLRLLSVCVFAIVLFAISVSFLTRSKRQVKVPEIDRALEERKIDKKERIEIRGMKRDEESFEVLTDRHYIGEDNLYHLEGNVKISLFKRSEGEDVILMGEEVIHTEDRSHFRLRGKAVVQFKDLTVASSVLEYDTKENVFRSDETVRFISGSVSGSARGCDYFFEEKKIELHGSVNLEIRPNLETPVALEIAADYFEYYVGKGLGKAQGEVDLKHGKSSASAGLMEFRLSASREQIKTLFLKEKAKISLVDEFEKIEPNSGQAALALHGDTCLLEAGEILIKGFVDSPRVQRLEAIGNCAFRFQSEKGSFTQIEGGKIVFDLTKKGTLKDLIVESRAKITEDNREEESLRTIDGQRVLIQGDKDVLTVEGADDTKARVRSESSEIEAQEIRVFLDSNDMEADRDTKVIIYPEETSGETSSFFSGENPIFITATEMRYSEEQKRFQFLGGARIWQTRETIKGHEMSFSVGTGAFQSTGSVESVLPYKPKGKEEDKNMRIESDTMEYDPEKNLIVYSENVSLKSDDADMTAKQLTIAFEEETGNMVNIIARDDVIVVQKTYEGHGKEANFDVGKEMITVTGNPVLFDKDKGKTEGGKLTFYMADGRIVVENKDRERSTTVIKN